MRWRRWTPTFRSSFLSHCPTGGFPRVHGGVVESCVSTVEQPVFSSRFFIHTKTFQRSSSSVISEFNAGRRIHHRPGSTSPPQNTHLHVDTRPLGWPAAHSHHVCVVRLPPSSTRPPLTPDARRVVRFGYFFVNLHPFFLKDPLRRCLACCLTNS